MDGIHDVGGMEGFGPATWPGADAPIHHDWEWRAFALALTASPASAHGFRYLIESLPPTRYLESSYYEKWLHEAEQALLEAGLIAPGEVEAWEARLAAGAEVPVGTRRPEAVAELLEGLTTSRPLPAPAEPRFSAGDRVRVRRMRPAWHTRCPRYLRGAPGVVARVQGEDGVPDVNNAAVEPVYAVRFASRDLWGPDVEPHAVYADLWERYLEPLDA